MPEQKRDHRGRFTGEKSPQQVAKEKFLQLALERFKVASDAEARWRREALEDFNFCELSEQWPVDIKTQRDRDRRPCLTINRLKTVKRLICNEMRQQRATIQVNPVGDGATVETAEMQQGLVRHIEVLSDSEVAYDTTDEHMVISGLGWLELSTYYRPGKTMQQEIHIGYAENPFMHYADPNADPTSTDPEKSKEEWHFKIHDYTRAEFEALYPDASAASLSDFSSIGDNAKEWMNKDTVRVAEYWYLDYEDSKLYQLPDGQIVEELPDGYSEDDEDVSSRPYRKPKCMWSKISAVDILEGSKDGTAGRETVWDAIPNIPVIGGLVAINGKRIFYGMVRDSKDPQRQFNYWETAATEMIALAPKAQWKGYAEVIEGHEEEWKNANRVNYSILTGKAVVKDGQLLPLPERDQAEPPIQAMAAMRQSGAANLEAVTGINDAVLGRQRADESGKAVLARQKQGDVSNLNYSDNSARAKRRVGRLLLPAIPKVYDIPTIMRIVNPDGTSSHVVTHLGDEQKADAQQLLKQNPALQKMLDLSVGTYDVTVSVGPNYQTKRQEAVASIMALIQATPEIISLVGDLLVGNMDWHQAPEIAKRLKLWVMQQNPWLAQQEGDTPEMQAQKAQAQLAALQQVHGQVVQALQNAQNIIQAKQVEQQGRASIEKMRIDADILLAKMKALTPIIVAEINTKAQDQTVRAEIDADLASELRSMAHDIAMSGVEHSQTIEQGDRAAANQAAVAAAQPQPGNSNGNQPTQ
jgi:hypothetical protein